MAGLPPENTPRLLVDYNDGIHDHTLTWRFANRTSSVAAAMDAANAFLQALSPSWYAITILGARTIDEGSHISRPVGWTGDAAYGTGAMPAVNAPRELRFEFRSPDGHKGSLGVYGVNVATPATYRLPATLFTFVSDARAELITATDIASLVAIDGLAVFVKEYANINFNSYWERKARS
jgi:hypothetical protein